MLINLSDHLHKNDLLSQDHKGVVVDNADPKRLARVKVSIPGLIESSDTSLLPWAYIKSPTSFGGRNDLSSRHIPEIGSEVLVKFPYKDPHMPVVDGYWQSETTTQGYLDEDYPNTYGFRDVQNTHLRINKVKKILEFAHASGARLFIDKDSLIELKSSKGIKFVSEDGKTVIFFDLDTGNMEIQSKTKTTMRGQELKVEHDTVNWQVGQITEEISGSRTTEILGGEKTVIGGSQSNSILGNRGDVVAGDQSVMVAGKTSASYGKDVKEVHGLNGNYTKQLLLGDHKTEILAAGGISRKTTLGNIEDEATVGDITHKTSSGKVSLETLLGDATIKTTAGKVSIETAVGKIEVDATGNIKLDGLMLDLVATAMLKVAGTAMTTVGSDSSPTFVKGAIVNLGGGALPVARLGDTTIGVGNMGAPVVGTIIQGSPKVLA